MKVAVRLPHMKQCTILHLDNGDDEQEFWVCYFLFDVKRMDTLINRLQQKQSTL